MKLIFLWMFSVMILLPEAAQSGEFCGSKEGMLNQIASAFIIPDYFPPETDALRVLISDVDYQRCSQASYAPLATACKLHDSCYDQRFPKDQCDKALRDNWIRSCKETYYKLSFDHQICRIACELFVKLMSEAQSYNSDGICPSCEAYEKTN